MEPSASALARPKENTSRSVFLRDDGALRAGLVGFFARGFERLAGDFLDFAIDSSGAFVVRRDSLSIVHTMKPVMTKPSAHEVRARVIRSLGDIGDTRGVIGGWSSDDRLCALVSYASPDSARSRWSVLASPRPEEGVIDLAREPDAIGALRMIEERVCAEERVPFVGGWLGWLGYDLGTEFEPTARHGRKERASRAGRGWLARCDAALLRDESTGEWFGAGVDDESVDRLLSMVGRGDSGRCAVGAFAPAQGRGAYERAVARTVEYIRAGDVFQANIAHELRASFVGSARDAFVRMLGSARPAFGALLEPPHGVSDSRVVCSISPELFLDLDFASRRIVTRPIKGTRPDHGSASSAQDLAASEKDSAELAMIVDLMRNDLSRVCEVGSVVVDEDRTIERHGGGGVLHAVATVSGTMREGVGFGDVVRATFPPGSVTGAPKIRAMQIIDELEPFARGAYCGAIGFVSDSGIARLSVAIRTATIDPERGEIVYPVGAGIVAESDPASEWDETIAKAEALTRAFGGGGEHV
jgi:anthranilate/para-aminobenzoate synthase component I